jgi:hypothetical protein
MKAVLFGREVRVIQKKELPLQLIGVFFRQTDRKKLKEQKKKGKKTWI